MSKIKSIIAIGTEPVYNMVVDEHHNYITADGIILKNCDSLRYFAQHRPVSAKLPDTRSYEEKMLAEHKKMMVSGDKKRRTRF